MSLIYNGINFTYPLTEVHTMGPERDPSGTDQLYTNVRLKVRSLLYVSQIYATILPPVQLGIDWSAGQLLARIRHHLTTPRRALYYDYLSLPGQTMQGITPAPIINIPDGMDDANGPWPDADAFSAVYTTADCVEVTWACTVKIRDCGFGSNPSEPISLRWEDSLTFDKYCKATYQRIGTCIISSRSALKPDELRRSAIAPRCPMGFHRTSSKYSLSRDGLRCDFAFTDDQVRFTPPYPAVEMDIVQSESFPLLGGMRIGQVEVNMVGVQNANVRELAMWALTVGKARVWAANPLQSANGTVVNGPSPPILRTRETNSGVDVSVVIPYKAPPKKKREGQSGGSGRFWGGLIGAGAGFLIGGPVGSAIGAGLGYLAGGLASPTKEGKDPTPQPVFPWIGAGTSPQSPTNPVGYATWANATGQIVGPADGVGLAPAVSLFAAFLGDPCGVELRSAPFSQEVSLSTRVQVNDYNTPAGGGQGGTPSTYDAQLSASLGVYNAAQYPAELSTADDQSLYEFDELPGVYEYWQCVNEYLTDPGTLVIPTCNPNGINIKVRHSSEMVTLRRRWAACRTGAEPKIPPRDQGDPNWVFTGEYLAPRELKVAPDGVSVQYEVSGIYEYQALDPTKVKKEAAVPPFLSAFALQKQIVWLEGDVELRGGPSGGSGSSSLIGGGGSSPLGSVPMLSEFLN